MTRRFLCAGLVAAVVVPYIWAAAPAAAAAKAPVRILSPAPDTLVTGRRLIVRFRAGAGVSHLRLRVAGRVLTTEKAPGAHGLRTATAAVRGLPHGRVSLTLRARRHGRPVFSWRPVILGRRTPWLLRSVALPRRAGGSARLRVRLGGRVSTFRVTVNGRRARMLGKPDQPVVPSRSLGVRRNGRPVARPKGRPATTTTIPLSADDGLRPGPNRVVVLAYRERTGRWARAARTVRMSRRAPLVAAGEDHRVIAGAAVRLSARNSRSVGGRGRLRYRWRIVAQPSLPRSRRPARLLDPRSVRPRLVTHRPGTYEVALGLAGAGRREAATASTASGPASEPPSPGPPSEPSSPETPSQPSPSPEPSASGPTASAPAAQEPAVLGDVTTVQAVASAPPYGLHITTDQPRTGGASRTTIEGVPINPDGTDDWVETFQEEVELIVLERSTLEVESVRSYPGTQAGIGEALEAFGKASARELAILSGPVGCCEKSLVSTLGFPFSAGFTLIGSGGQVIAYNGGHELGEGPGGVSGLLRQSVDSAGGLVGYTFVYPEVVDFDTYVEGPLDSVDTDFAGQLTRAGFASAGPAIAITALSPALERIPSLSGTFQLQGDEQDQTTLVQVLQRLEAISDQVPGAVLMLQTIDDPRAQTPVWGEIGEWLANFGGTPSVWDGLDGSGNYALVGTSYPGQKSLTMRQASTAEASGPMEGTEATKSMKPWVGTLRGVLGRGANGLPVIRSSTSLPTGNDPEGRPINPDGLALLAESAPGPWPLSDPAHEAALSWISERIGPVGPGGRPEGLGNPKAAENGGWCYSPTNWDVRAEYCNVNLEWSEYARQLDGLTCPAGEKEFTAADCREVVEQLSGEFGDIATVDKLVANLQKPFERSGGAVAVAFAEAARKVEEEVVEPKEYISGVGPGDMVSSILGPMQDTEFAIDTTEAAETDGTSVLLGLLESAANLGFEIAAESDGGPATTPFDVSAKQLGAEAEARLETAVKGIGRLQPLLVSDWTKLSTAAADAATIWSLGESSLDSATAHVLQGSKGWLLEQLLPAAYAEIQVVPKKGPSFAALKGVYCRAYAGPDHVETYYPFEGMSPAGVFVPAVGTGADGSQVNRYMWALGNATGTLHLQVPSGTLMEELFRPVPAGGIGLYAAPFFTWGWPIRNPFSKYLARHNEELAEPYECSAS